MDKNVLFSCEQTVGCTGCTGKCRCLWGKSRATAKLQDELTGALISRLQAADSTETISKEPTDHNRRIACYSWQCKF